MPEGDRGELRRREKRGWMMTFISETRKAKKKIQGWNGGVVVVKGGRKGSSGGEEGGEKKCFAWLQSKRAEEDGVFFAYAWQQR